MVAIRQLIAAYVIALLSMVIDWDYYSTVSSLTTTLIQQLITGAAMVWLYWKIFVGRNWAGIVLLVSTVASILMMFIGASARFVAAMPMTSKIMTWSSAGVTVVVLWLLFASPGREWYRKR